MSEVLKPSVERLDDSQTIPKHPSPQPINETPSMKQSEQEVKLDPVEEMTPTTDQTPIKLNTPPTTAKVQSQSVTPKEDEQLKTTETAKNEAEENKESQITNGNEVNATDKKQEEVQQTITEEIADENIETENSKVNGADDKESEPQTIEKSEIEKPSKSMPTKTSKIEKRKRVKTEPYQAPLPEIEIISKMSKKKATTNRNKNNEEDEKLTAFFKNEFLAVRNSEGGFYVCRTLRNVKKSSTKIRIRWFSLDDEENGKKNNEMIFKPDFYDNTDFDCILTNLKLKRMEGGKFLLPAAEKRRTDSILKRSLAAEKGEFSAATDLNADEDEEHPDGLDLSLYKDENQLNKRRKRGTKRKATTAGTPDKSPKVAKKNGQITKKVDKVKDNLENAKLDEKKAKIVAKFAKKTVKQTTKTKGGKKTTGLAKVGKKSSKK